MQDYLLGSAQPGAARGAHERYRPKDWRSRECREKMMNAANDGAGPDALRRAFDQVYVCVRVCVCTRWSPASLFNYYSCKCIS